MLYSSKVRLIDMERRLQAQVHYDRPHEAFRDLLYCFSVYLYKEGAESVLKGWRENRSMSDEEARRFEEYCGYRLLTADADRVQTSRFAP